MEPITAIAAINATTALLYVPCGGMGAVPEGAEICYKVSDETCSVANALGTKADAAAVRETLRKTIFELHQGHFTSRRT